jgi:predicted alpha/beta superfamily hydrolase
MNKKTTFIIGLALVSIGTYIGYRTISNLKEEKKHKEWVDSLEHTASDNVKILTDAVHIDYLDEQRSLAIYLPENYEMDTHQYSVIYFMDGESLFDQKIQEGLEWQIDEVLDSLGKRSEEQSIIVGIYSSEDRLREYKPFPSTRWYSHKRVSGDQHADWIVNTVKPWIDAKYRTNKEANSTYIAGASLGGLMSYYMLMHYPNIFGGAIVFSPSFWVNEVVYDLHKTNPELFEQKIYFNAGELETPTVYSIQKMREILINYGMPEDKIRLDVEQGEGHWHMSWRKGFKKAYPWIVINE